VPVGDRRLFLALGFETVPALKSRELTADGAPTRPTEDGNLGNKPPYASASISL
jgi:hypothetical protein